MSPIPRRNPYFYWTFCLLNFFIFLGCGSLPKLGFSRDPSEISGQVLSFKSPRKMNPSFFKEGSNHFSFIEWDGTKKSGFLQKIEFSFLRYDNEFLSKMRSEWSGSKWEPYKITYRKKIGTFKLGATDNTIEFNYKQTEMGETTGEKPESLFKNLSELSLKKTSIDEYEIFELDKTTGVLREEGMVTLEGKQLVWTHNPGNINVFSPATHFAVSKADKITTEFDSSHYDYYQILYEKNSTEFDRLFYKLIYSEDNLHIYFVPPYSNELSMKTKEPLGFQRIGNFLIKEDKK